MIQPIVWSIDCEGELLRAWSGERPDWCSISITASSRDRDDALDFAESHGWKIIVDQLGFPVCPGCAKVLLAAGTIEEVKTEQHDQLLFVSEAELLRLDEVPDRPATRQEINQAQARNAMFEDVADAANLAAQDLRELGERPRGGIIEPGTVARAMSSFHSVLTTMSLFAGEILPDGLDAAAADPRLHIRNVLLEENGRDAAQQTNEAVSSLHALAAALNAARAMTATVVDPLFGLRGDWDHSPTVPRHTPRTQARREPTCR